MGVSHMTWRRGAGFLWIVVLIAVVLADWLFYKRPVGCSAAIFATGVLGILVAHGRRIRRDRAGWFFVAAAAGLALALFEQPGLLNLTMALAALGFLAMIERAGWVGSVGAWIHRWIRFTGEVLVRMILDSRIASRWFKRHPEARPMLLRVALAWIIPLLLGGVFIWLFASANPIILQWVKSAWDRLAELIEKFPEIVTVARVMLWVGVAAAMWAVLRSRGARGIRGAEAIVRPPPLPDDPWEPRLRRGVLRCLVVFNVIFLVQTMLDLTYLAYGAKLPAGMTHAEYAHRGAYPLLAAALLAAIFVLVTFRKGSMTERDPWARRLVYLWLTQNVMLTGTAVWRLALYVSEASLTRWRIAAAIWMLLVAMGLAWILWRIFSSRDNAWLLRMNILTAATVLYACCFVNFDRFIADYNAAHCMEAGTSGWFGVDVDYLVHLGPDALPALIEVKDKIQDPQRQRRAEQGIAMLHADLDQTLADWRGWTWRRARLASSLPPGVPSAEYVHGADSDDSRSATGWRW